MCQKYQLTVDDIAPVEQLHEESSNHQGQGWRSLPNHMDPRRAGPGPAMGRPAAGLQQQPKLGGAMTS